MYCTQCHRECEGAGDSEFGFAEVSKCHRAPVLEGYDQWVVMAIRRMWAADVAILAGRRGHLNGVDRAKFNPDYPFATNDERDADVNLLKAFHDERPHQDSDLETIWVLIRG